MKKFGDFICKHKSLILILTGILMIPTIIGMVTTKINYDILVYLPEDIETIQGQNILTNDFNMGAFAVTILDDMPAKNILNLEKEIKKIEGVSKVVSVYDLTGSTIPLEMLPDDLVGKVKKEDSDLMIITFENSTSDEVTLNAVEEIRELTKNHCKIGGMSAMVLDTMNLSEKEITIYVIIAVALCLLVLEISLDSLIVPILLLANIGISILFNLGTNVLLGEISYITKALVAVLQLGVTTDFSIFLYHSYESKKSLYKTKEEAMSSAITETFTSVVGSSLTTIAGFLVLCTMSLTLGKDLGIVMAKGVFLGVVSVLTIFPSLLLIFDKWIDKTSHRILLPKFTRLNKFIIKHYKKSFIIFLLLLIPAYLANSKVDVYYKLDESLPKTLDSIVANKELKEKFNIVSPEILLIDKNLKANDVNQMISEIESIQGVDFVLSFTKLSEFGLSDQILSEETKSIFENEEYQMILLNSTYDIATEELNNQVDEINQIIKKYDKDSILAGEGPLMKDLVTISDRDFNNVNYSSIGCILIIMFLVLKSISLPILLIAVIEFAIFVNMSIPYFSSITLPFVAPIVLGTIELGATIDYAILMTTTYLKNRSEGKPKMEAMENTLNSSVSSIIVSGLCFFSATFGVGIYSDLEMISSLCTLISRGAIISMLVVILILPSVLLIFDKLICKTTKIKKKENVRMKRNLKKSVAVGMLGLITYSTLITPVLALTKEEVVYGKLNSDGSTKKVLVQEHLVNNENLETIKDITDIKDIVNLNGEERFTQNEESITWETKGKDIFYQGTSEKEMPIHLSITYYLNGEEKDIKEILGKSGHITIKLKYTNKDKHIVNVNGEKETLYTPFIITTATMIDLENNSNVSVENGKVIDNGTKNIILGLTAPGLYESLNIEKLKSMDEVTINFDTEKFKLSSIYSVATPKIIRSEDLKVLDKVNSLYQSINLLQESMNTLEKGTYSLREGTETLSAGSTLIYENLKLITEKMKELEKGAISLDSGLEQILDKLTEVKGSLSSDIGELSQIETLITTNKETIARLESTNQLLSETYQMYHLENFDSLTILSFTEEVYSNFGFTLSKEEVQIMNNKLLTAKINYESSYEANTNLITLLTTNNQALEKTVSSLKQISTNITGMIPLVENILKEIKEGSKQVSVGTTALREAVEMITLKTGELSSGAVKVMEGSNQIAEGSTKLNQEGITKLNTMVSGKLKPLENKIKALVKLGEDYDTFTKKEQGVEGTTKFIMTVNSEKVADTKIITQRPKEKESFLTKLKNLFK